MPDFTVARRGTDSSGRPIYATAFYWQVWQAILDDDRIKPFAHLVTVVQGAFMERVSGGGASASAGYHDKGGCFDVRTWNLSAAQQQALWDVAWEYGMCFWKRGPSAVQGGMDEHGHSIGGWDEPLDTGAEYQWWQARNGKNGLANNGPDYMRRKGKLPSFPPEHLLKKDYLMTSDAEKKLDRIITILNTSNRNQRERDKELLDAVNAAKKAQLSKKTLVASLGGLIDQLGILATNIEDTATKTQVRRLRKMVAQALEDDPDVDGADNPSKESTLFDDEEDGS